MPNSNCQVAIRTNDWQAIAGGKYLFGFNSIFDYRHFFIYYIGSQKYQIYIMVQVAISLKMPSWAMNFQISGTTAKAKETVNMFKQLLTGGSVLALLLVGGFSAQAKPQASVLQAQTQEVPTTPDTQTTPPAGTIEPGTSPEGTTTPDTTAPDATTPDSGTSPEGTTTPDSGTSPEGTTTPDITPDASTPETTSPDATTSPDSGDTSAPESQTSTPDSNQQRAGINCESNPIAEPTGGGSREFRECQ